MFARSREMLKLAALTPPSLLLVAQDFAPPLKTITWVETPETSGLMGQMMPQLDKYKAERRITALTPDEWDALEERSPSLSDRPRQGQRHAPS